MRRGLSGVVFFVAFGLAACHGSSSPAPTAVSSSAVTPVTPPSDLKWVERVLNAEPDAKLPMLVVLHGLGDNPDSFIEAFRPLAVPVRVIAARAPDAYGSGFSWFPTRLDTSGITVFAEGVATSASRVVALMQKLSVERPTTGKPIVCGFSQGGMLSFTVAALHPDSVAASFPISGFLPAPISPKERPKSGFPPIFALHGTSDPRVDIGLDRDTVERLRQLGADATLKEYPGIGHTISPVMRLELKTRLEAALRGGPPP